LHGETPRFESQAVCVAIRGKNRKENAKTNEPEAHRSEPEQAVDPGMSDEIVRDFLVESSTQP